MLDEIINYVQLLQRQVEFLSMKLATVNPRQVEVYTGSEIFNYMGGLDGEKKQLIHKLVNFRMKQGKKTRVRVIFHETLHRLARTDCDGIELISDALENVKPVCEVAKVRIAGNMYDVPGVVDRDRQQTLVVRWILDEAIKSKRNLKTARDWRNVCFLRLWMLTGNGEMCVRKGRTFIDLLPPTGVMLISDGGKISHKRAFFLFNLIIK
ncbi:putative transcription factor bHLH family [Helianthus annuus]|nr:putative transcription factor bHLH family [Helianthus annuus]